MVRVIPVTGLSGSGKTTFIRTLIPLLTRLGPVGTVKHIGHHTMELPEEKDTTTMFGAGAEAAIGIDQEKMLITLDSTSLAEALDTLSGRGIAFAVVEGYKSGPLPKIAIGDVNVEACILRNPEPEEVIRSLDRFPSYFTLGEILRELGDEGGASKEPVTLVTTTIPLPPKSEGNTFSILERALPRIADETAGRNGVIKVRAEIQRGALFSRPDELLIAIAGENGDAAAAALTWVFSRSREFLEARDIHLL